MSDILKKICINKKEEIKKAKSKCSLNSLIKLLPEKKNRNFKKLIIDSQKNNTNNIIAEIKKSSPSAGELINNYVPEDIAIHYEKCGAGAISILTDNKYFNGKIDHISIVHNKTNLPILRKDFILDIYQIYESKVFKADAILLILTILSDQQVKEYINLAEELGLDCIIETHSKDEIDRAVKIGYPIIGINNRNLDNLSIDIDNTLNLIKKIPREFCIIGESGIKTNKDIKKYNESMIFNFLIGESILKAKNINEKFIELLEK